jgi:hypothetical protein
MPEIKVQHDLNKADKPPARQPIPPGTYEALIVAAVLGLAKKSGLNKFTVEYRLLKTVDGDETMSGRRVFQDYVFEAGSDPEVNSREAYRIRQLLDATNVDFKHSDGSFAFNTDHLHNKSVRILVTQRAGTQVGQDGTVPIFHNVDRVDTAVALNSADIV